ARGNDDRHTLGLPGRREDTERVPVAALIPSWLPLRAPSLHLVYEEDGRIVGSCRALEEPHRADWVIVELDAVDHPMAAEVRFQLLQAVIAEGAQRHVARFHAACSAAGENLELFNQLGFVGYAEEQILYRGPEAATVPAANGAARDDDAAAAMVPAQPSHAWELFRLWSEVTPPPVARTDGYRASDWETADREAVVPRSSLTPLLRFSDVRSWILPDRNGAAAFVQHGVSRRGPHYLRLIAATRTDPTVVVAAALDAAGNEACEAGILTPVRTYEAPLRSAAADAGFELAGEVRLLVRDVRAAIRQPAMVPAVQ
ncbi:MAG: GNAT family N-acetyltransferase, partial [Chloroflexota bacterium]|nr:GNAT family N-acetyltransferase [Chloroflexota bacterium]